MNAALSSNAPGSLKSVAIQTMQRQPEPSGATAARFCTTSARSVTGSSGPNQL